MAVGYRLRALFSAAHAVGGIQPLPPHDAGLFRSRRVAGASAARSRLRRRRHPCADRLALSRGSHRRPAGFQPPRFYLLRRRLAANPRAARFRGAQARLYSRPDPGGFRESSAVYGGFSSVALPALLAPFDRGYALPGSEGQIVPCRCRGMRPAISAPLSSPTPAGRCWPATPHGRRRATRRCAGLRAGQSGDGRRSGVHPHAGTA